MSTTSTYIVTQSNGSDINVRADSVEHDVSSGRYNFYTGADDKKELVASFLNISFRKAS